MFIVVFIYFGVDIEDVEWGKRGRRAREREKKRKRRDDGPGGEDLERREGLREYVGDWGAQQREKSRREMR
jgi:hypothetical protein